MAGGGVKINNIKIVGGADGRTATFNIDSDGHLYNTFDSGETWNDLGRVVGDDGADGQNGKGFNPRGEWLPNTTYYNDATRIDVVKDGVNSYYCKMTHTGGDSPSTAPNYWGILAEGGGIVRKMYESFVDAADWGDFSSAPHPTSYYSPFNFRAVKQMSQTIDGNAKTLVVDPIYKERYGLAIGEIAGDTVEFYAKTKPPIGFEISFYSDEVQIEDILDVTYSKDTSVFYYSLSSYLAVECDVTGTKYWGDGDTNSNTVHSYSAAGDYTVKCNITDGKIEGHQGDQESAFGTEGLLVKANVGESVEKIEGWAFAKERNLTEVTLPETITLIGYHAFDSCSQLTRITIPKSVVEISTDVFYMSGVLNFYYDGTMAEWNAIKYEGTDTTIEGSWSWYGNYQYRDITVRCSDGDIIHSSI